MPVDLDALTAALEQTAAEHETTLSKDEDEDAELDAAMYAVKSSRTLAQQYAEDRRDPNRIESIEARIDRVYSEHPWLYAAENVLSDAVSARRSRARSE